VRLIGALRLTAAAICCLLPGLSAWSQEPSPGAGDDRQDQAGYQAVPSFGGPSSVGAQLKVDSARGPTPYRFEPLTRALEPYYAFKDRLNESHGLAFGGDYSTLYQAASDSPGEDDGAAGVLRVYGTWVLTGRGAGNSGSLTVKFENRHDLGTDITPKQLAGELDYAGLTAVTYSDAGWRLDNLYWHQSLLGNRLGLVAGMVDVTDYLDVYGLVSPWTDFSNLAFTTSPTIPAPDPGLGAALRVTVADSYYLLAGIADANGDPGDPSDGFDTFFSDREYFTHLEFGWFGSWEQRDTDNVHLSLWHVDERQAAGIARGWGTAFSASRKLAEHWVPFIRAGHSDSGGTLVDTSVSTGFGYLRQERSDLIGAAVTWAQPAEEAFGSGRKDQYAAEFFWRLQLFPHLTLTPDVQYLVNVADENGGEDNVWVVGIRARMAL